MFALNILIFIYLLYFLVGNILKDTHSWEGLENSPEPKFQMKVHLFQLIYPFHNWLSVAVLAYFLADPCPILTETTGENHSYIWIIWISRIQSSFNLLPIVGS